jgi:hypothetical protein
MSPFGVRKPCLRCDVGSHAAARSANGNNLTTQLNQSTHVLSLTQHTNDRTPTRPIAQTHGGTAASIKAPAWEAVSKALGCLK